MNLNWRTKRQLFYLALPLVPALLIAGWLIFQSVATASCSDGKLNQGERGIDCEGPCPRICAERVRELRVNWTKAFAIETGNYSLVSEIENQNEDLGIPDLPVNFTVYAADGQVIYTGNTLFDVRPSQKAYAFLGPIPLGVKPDQVRVDFETIGRWRAYADPPLEPLRVVSKNLEGATSANPRLEAAIENTSFSTLEDVPVVALVQAEDGNAVAVSQTYVDFAPNSTADLTYTWPTAFPTSKGVCQQPVDLMLVLDASGSMNDLGANPPEPIATVKNAAKQFGSLFGNEDRVGVIQFATTADLILDPTNNHSEVGAAIDAVEITPVAEAGYTNIAAALELANHTLGSTTTSNEQAVVVLTDGQPTSPQPDPVAAAITAADTLRESGVSIYAIGLGDSVDADLLLEMTNTPDNVFTTTSASELNLIYSQIATTVCERAPYLVNLYPNVGLE